MSFTIGFYLISGMMLGVEIQRNPNTGNPVLVLDLLIVRLMFEYGNEDDE
jgi:hypothetical protein